MNRDESKDRFYSYKDRRKADRRRPDWVSCDTPPGNPRQVHLTTSSAYGSIRKVHLNSRYVGCRWINEFGALIQDIPVSWLDVVRVEPDMETEVDTNKRLAELIAATELYRSRPEEG